MKVIYHHFRGGWGPQATWNVMRGLKSVLYIPHSSEPTCQIPYPSKKNFTRLFLRELLRLFRFFWYLEGSLYGQIMMFCATELLLKVSELGERIKSIFRSVFQNQKSACARIHGMHNFPMFEKILQRSCNTFDFKALIVWNSKRYREDFKHTKWLNTSQE